MSAKIRLLKSNIMKNKSTKLFFKTMSSKFFHKAKSPKLKTDITITKSTSKFSDNNLTNTLYSSKNRDNSLFIGLEDFHKKFVLNKNNFLKTDYLTNFNNSKKKLINLKKSNLSPSIDFSSLEQKQEIIPILKNNKIRTINNDEKIKTQKNSFYSLYDENDKNKNKDKKIQYLFNLNQRNNYMKTLKTVQNKQIKSELYKSENFNEIDNISSNKNINIFKTYNNYNNLSNQTKNKNYLNLEYSTSNDLNKDTYKNNEIHLKNENKNDKTILYYARNNPKLMDKFAYPNYHYSIRIETSQEFFFKTKINIFNKYRKYLNSHAYMEREEKKKMDIDKEIMQERNIKKFEKLFSIYQESLESYLQFLHKKFTEIQDENAHFKKDKYQILGEIEKIKVKIMKGMSRIKEGFSIKYFLTCVKNHTLSPDGFSPEDLKEIENDRLKLNTDYYLVLQPKKQKTKSYRRQSVSNIFLNNYQVKRIQEHSLTKRIKNQERRNSTIIPDKVVNKNFMKKKTKQLIDVKIPKRFKVISTREEFFEHLDFISSEVYNLIIDYNNKYYRNVYLKLELENIIKRSSDSIEHSNYLESQIDLYEKQLHDLKSKNNILVSNYKKLKQNQLQRDVKLLLVIQYIHQIYSNIKKDNKEIIDITKEMVISYGERYYLKMIEQFFFKLFIKVNEIKKRKQNVYDIIKNKLDRKKKKNAFYKYQKLLAEKIEIKINTVLQSAEKIIYKKYRKTNDYRREHKKHKIKKKEVKKSNLELFSEFLDDDSY